MREPFSRREWLGLGFSSVAGMLAIPRPFQSFDATLQRAPSDINVALQAARWIRKARIETPAGIAWPEDPLKPAIIGNNLYNGMPGVIVFHLELFHAIGTRSWLDEAKAGANELIARLPALESARACGLYTGLAGAAFVLEEVHRTSGEGKYRDAAKRAIASIHSLAQRQGDGVQWAGPSAANDIIAGSAGIGLLLLWADRQFGTRDNTELALAVGRRLITNSVKSGDGLSWQVTPGGPVAYPNFSHGTAGVSFFLATLHQATANADALTAATAGARYLESVANTEGGGFKVFHNEPGGRDRYYLSWCHGPAGTSRLFERLASVTGVSKWTDLATRCACATIDSGVPEKQSPGYWNNISQCCGNCGVGEYFISLQRRRPSAAYGEMIRRVVANTLARGTADGDGMKWIQAENRVSPDAVVAQTGYMQGAAGVGTFFLHADGLAKGRSSPVIWPDAI